MRKIMTIVLIIAIMIVNVTPSVVAQSVTFNTKEFKTTNKNDSNLKINLQGDQITFKITGAESDKAWVRVIDTTATNEEVGSIFSSGSDKILNKKGKEVPEKLIALNSSGNGETTVKLGNVNKTNNHKLEVYMAVPGGNRFRIDFGKYELRLVNVTNEQGRQEWKLRVNQNILTHNYQRTIGSNEVQIRANIEKKLKDLSNEIVAGETSDYNKVYKIYNWVANNIYYDRDYSEGRTNKTSHEPLDVLETKKAVCEGYSRLLRDLVQAQGIKAIQVAGYSLAEENKIKWDSETEARSVSNHAWNEVYIKDQNRWITIDSTWASNNEYLDGQFNKNTDRFSDSYFDMTLEALSLSHKILETPRGVGQADYKEVGKEEGVGEGTSEPQEPTKPTEQEDTGTAVIEVDPNKKYRNTPSKWAEQDVYLAYNYKLVEANLFRNFDKPITRAEFAGLAANFIVTVTNQPLDVLAREIGKYDKSESFKDTNDTKINNLYRMGIISGVGDGNFAPDRGISRKEAASLLTNIAKLLPIPSSNKIMPLQFTDTVGQPEWVVDGIEYITSIFDPIKNTRIMTGVDNGRFGVNRGYTVEQSIVTFLRLYNSLR